MDDEGIRSLLLPRGDAQTGFAQPDFDALAKELALPGVTRKLVWNEYCNSISEGGGRAYGYAQFCRLFDRHLRASGARMHLEHDPGRRMFVDWAGGCAEVTDGVTGSVRKAYLFVSCLPYSDIIYARCYLDMGMDSWLDGHMRSFEHFGGVPYIIVPDNCATATDRSPAYVTLVNETYHEFASYYQTAVVPARVRRANDKALVESAVLICERSVLAPLRHERFFSLGDLNDAVLERVAAVNAAPFQKRDGSRDSVFAAEERHLLKPLPATRWERAEWRRCKVGPDYHVCADHMRYSVPYRLIGEEVDVRLTSTEVRVYKGHGLVCSHERAYGRKGSYRTEASHMPKGHQEADIAWTPDRFERWAAGVGPATAAAIGRVLASKAIVEQAFVPCMNILGLAKGGRRELLEAACAEVAGRGAFPSYTHVKDTMAAIRARAAAKAAAAKAAAAAAKYA